MQLSRLARFTVFTLLDYARSGRVLVEVIAAIVAYGLLFRPTGTPMSPEAFFSLTGILTLIGACYSTSMIMGLSDRAQGYLVLSRRIGRAGYLVGHYLAALLVATLIYALLSLLTAILSPVAGLGFGGWVLGSLPLVLNIAVVAAAVTLLAPIVLTAGWRLVLLGAVALAFSGSLINGQALNTISPVLRNLLGTLQVACSAPLLPVFTGFALSVSRDYSPASVAILLAQLSLTCGLLALALYAFTKREIVLQG